MATYVYRDGKIVRKSDLSYLGKGRWVDTGPAVISDEMPPTEQVDGVHYTSKAKFRAVGRSLGLIEVGNEKFPVKTRSTASRAHQEARRQAIKDAIERYKAGHRAGR